MHRARLMRRAAQSVTEKHIETIEKRLVRAIRQVAERAPEARIIFVGYPEFFPESGPCTQLPLALGDYAFAHRVNELLVRAQKQAAARANVEYVDVFTAPEATTCAQTIPGSPARIRHAPTPSPYHPYPEEQQLVADLLVDRLS